jgi:acetyl esterase/lipase
LPAGDLTDLARARTAAAQRRHATPASRARRDLIVQNVPRERVRVFRAAGLTGGLPGLVYLRASAFVLGAADDAENPARQLADDLDIAVAVVDYRLAPEFPYPAGLADCFGALCWATGDQDANHSCASCDPRTLSVSQVRAVDDVGLTGPVAQ